MSVKIGQAKPKWRKRTIHDDYFGDVEWFICSECDGKPERASADCRCSCPTPHGQCG
jgi:hypothetical protein